MKKLPSHPMDDAAADSQSSYVRELLDAGRADGAGNYDVEAGLSRHAALVQSGAPLPEWAQGLTREALTTGAAAGASKAAGVKLLPWLLTPVVTAGVIAAVVLSAPDRSERKPAIAPHADSAPSDVSELAKTGEPRAEALEPGVAPAVAPSTVHELDAVEIEADDGESAAVRVKRDVLARRAQANAASSGKQGSAVQASGAAAKSLDTLMERARTESTGKVGLAQRPTPSASSETAAAREEAQAPAEQAAVPAPKPELDDSRLEREMGMLATAQRVLKSDPERALRLARQGEQEFAGSMFTQERQQVLLLALIELGRMPEAKRLALPYLKRYPNGPFSDRLRKAIATGRVEN